MTCISIGWPAGGHCEINCKLVTREVGTVFALGEIKFELNSNKFQLAQPAVGALQNIAKLTVNESEEKWGRFLPFGKLMTAAFITVTSICKSTPVGLRNITHHAVFWEIGICICTGIYARVPMIRNKKVS